MSPDQCATAQFSPQFEALLEANMHLHVFMGRNPRPVVVETNVAFALPYWTKRKETNPKIHWSLK